MLKIKKNYLKRILSVFVQMFTRKNIEKYTFVRKLCQKGFFKITLKPDSSSGLGIFN